MNSLSSTGRLTTEQKLRCGHVTRWHIVRTARAQTIADHQYRVWVLTWDICEALQVPVSTRAMLCHLALIHDRHEVIMGDVPTPGKQLIEAFPGVPRETFEDIGCHIDLEYGDLLVAVTAGYPVGAIILKVADLLEAADFIGVEGIGPHAEEAFTSLMAPLREALREIRERFPQPEMLQSMQPAHPIDRFYTLATHAASERNWRFI